MSLFVINSLGTKSTEEDSLVTEKCEINVISENLNILLPNMLSD